MDARLLACFAHPDDEAFGCGGTMAQYRQRGIPVTLVCATKGEAGEISDPALATPENLGLVRSQELLNATAVLGVEDVRFLGYRDSGMAGTEDNQNPAAYAIAPDAEVISRLVRIIREVRPQVVITFDPTGGYGHPDHLAIHRHTVAAVHQAADPTVDPGGGDPWQVRRLFYPVISSDTFEALRDQLIAQGDDPPEWFNEDDPHDWPDQSIDARIDVSRVIDAKWDAFKSHRTQFGADNPFMRVPEAFVKSLFVEERFEQAWPEEKPGEPYTDLFEGLD